MRCTSGAPTSMSQRPDTASNTSRMMDGSACCISSTAMAKPLRNNAEACAAGIYGSPLAALVALAALAEALAEALADACDASVAP